MKHLDNTLKLNQVCDDDGNTLRDHQRSVMKDFERGIYGSNEKIKASFSELELELSFVMPPKLANSLFIASKMSNCSPLEIKALSDLYSMELSPLEVDTVLKIKRRLSNVATSNIGKSSS